MADFRGLHEIVPRLVQHSGLIRTQIILVIRQRLETHSKYNMVQGNGGSASKCAFSSMRHCPLSVCSLTVWLEVYAQGTEVMFVITVPYSLIETANKTEAMFCIT